jgi:hypothetical protein
MSLTSRAISSRPASKAEPPLSPYPDEWPDQVSLGGEATLLSALGVYARPNAHTSVAQLLGSIAWGGLRAVRYALCDETQAKLVRFRDVAAAA